MTGDKNQGKTGDVSNLSGDAMIEKMHTQDILKAFDYETTVDEPSLSASEVTNALAEHFDIHVTDEAVRVRLTRMSDDGLVGRQRLGPATAYRALVAPELSDEVKHAVEETTDYEKRGESEVTTHEELKAQLVQDQ